MEFGYGTKAERWSGTIVDGDTTRYGGLPPGTEVRRSSEESRPAWRGGGGGRGAGAGAAGGRGLPLIESVFETGTWQGTLNTMIRCRGLGSCDEIKVKICLPFAESSSSGFGVRGDMGRTEKGGGRGGGGETKTARRVRSLSDGSRRLSCCFSFAPACPRRVKIVCLASVLLLLLRLCPVLFAVVCQGNVVVLMWSFLVSCLLSPSPTDAWITP